MKQKRLIYAMVLAVIYITATSLSSISLLTCHHDHASHTHHTERCEHGCNCNHRTLNEVCCDHNHPILGEHHTEYIAKNTRGDSSLLQAVAITLSPAILAEIFNFEWWLQHPITTHYFGDEAMPLLAASHRAAALRAPPALV